MTIRDEQNEQHKVIPFDEFLEDRCDTAPIEWIDEQLQINGLDAAPVFQNVQRIIARREAEGAMPARSVVECAVHGRKAQRRRKPIRFLSRTAALFVGVPLAFAALGITPMMSLTVIGPDPDEVRMARTRYLSATGGALPMFSTRKVHDDLAQHSLTAETFKEAYFRENVPYGEIIFREARRNGLSPELVAAMVHTESDFRSTLVSQKSAQGLMQIVPSVARLLGIRDPFDPEQNIAAGTKYFRYLLDRFDDETVALAAYNAGEGNVERFGGVPPFLETKTYIVKVKRRTDRYRQRVQQTYLATLKVAEEAH